MLAQLLQMSGLQQEGVIKAREALEGYNYLAGPNNLGAATAPLPRLWAAARGRADLVVPLVGLVVAIWSALPRPICKSFMDELCGLLKEMSEPDFEPPAVVEARREGDPLSSAGVLKEIMVHQQEGLLKIQSEAQDRLTQQLKLETEVWAAFHQRGGAARAPPPPPTTSGGGAAMRAQSQGVSPPPGLGATGQGRGRGPAAGEGCYSCGQPGHVRRYCPTRGMGQQGAVAAPPGPAPGHGGGAAAAAVPGPAAPEAVPRAQ